VTAGGSAARVKPTLYVDIDGVLSLFSKPGQPAPIRPDTHFMTVEGVAHLIALENCARLLALADAYELVWATGWEEKANANLLDVVGLNGPLETLSFDDHKYDHQAHWKLGALEAHSADKAIAWIDDAHDDVCHSWGLARRQPTLLVDTEPHIGLSDHEFNLLIDWAPFAQAADRA